MKIYFFFFLIPFLYIACGQNEEGSRGVAGNWRLQEISCFIDSALIESWKVTGDATYEYVFSGLSTEIRVNSGVHACGLRYLGDYGISENNDGQGTLEFDFRLDQSDDCPIRLFSYEDGNLDIGTYYDVSTYPRVATMRDVYWKRVDADNAEIAFPSEVFGSGETTKCNRSCTCYGKFKGF